MNYLEKVSTSFERQRIMHHVGATLVAVEKGYCAIELPYNLQLTQQDEYMHAGIYRQLA